MYEVFSRLLVLRQCDRRFSDMDAVIDGEALVLAVALLLLKDARLLQDGSCGGFVLDFCDYIFSRIEKR